jgi:hypothetical protein
MIGYANVEVTGFAVFEGEDGVVGTLTGILTAHTTGERFPVTMVELHDVVGATTRRIDVYLKTRRRWRTSMPARPLEGFRVAVGLAEAAQHTVDLRRLARHTHHVPKLRERI